MSDTIYESEYLLITGAAAENLIHIQSGNPPEDDFPTSVNAAELAFALLAYKMSQDNNQ